MPTGPVQRDHRQAEQAFVQRVLPRELVGLGDHDRAGSQPGLDPVGLQIDEQTVQPVRFGRTEGSIAQIGQGGSAPLRERIGRHGAHLGVVLVPASSLHHRQQLLDLGQISRSAGREGIAVLGPVHEPRLVSECASQPMHQHPEPIPRLLDLPVAPHVRGQDSVRYAVTASQGEPDQQGSLERPGNAVLDAVRSQQGRPEDQYFHG
ncbi:hypothetical protein GCM10029976_005220 [Kribbella albertanoniae]